MKFSKKLLLIIFLMQLLCLSTVWGLSVEPVSPEQTIANAEMIVIGTITYIKTSWSGINESMIASTYSITIDELIYDPDALFGKKSVGEQIELSFAGGKIGEKIVRIPGVPQYQLNEQALFFIDQDEINSISPLVGVTAGDYRISSNRAGLKIISDFTGAIVERHFFSSYKNRLGGFTVEEFIAEILRAIPIAKSDPSLIITNDLYIPDDIKHLVFTGDQIPKATPYLGNSFKNIGSISTPKIDFDNLIEVPKPVDLIFYEPNALGQDILEIPNNARYAFLWGPPDANSTFNIPPIYYSGAQWGANFEYSLSDWNNYSDLFRKFVTADNQFGHQGRNDFAFTDLVTFQNTYGFSLPSTILGIAVMFNSNGDDISSGEKIYEADVILNVDKGWTLDWSTGYNNCSIWYFRAIVIHELGHCFGREHQFTADPSATYHSVMNYSPCGALNTEFYLPKVDDPQSIRVAYPALAQTVNDLSVNFFRTAGGGTNTGIPVVWSIFPSSAAAGGTFTMSNFIIENLGTSTMTPTIGWYLTTNQQSYSGSYYLMSTSHATLSSFSYWNTSRTITVPGTVPTGDYYIAAAIQADDLNWNRSAWSNTKISIYCCLIRGDVNHDSILGISDLTSMVDYLFNGGPAPSCNEEGDVNNDGTIGISDLTFLVDYLFNGGPTPSSC